MEGPGVCFSLLPSLRSNLNAILSTKPCAGNCNSTDLCLSIQAQEKVTKEIRTLGKNRYSCFKGNKENQYFERDVFYRSFPTNIESSAKRLNVYISSFHFENEVLA